MTTDQALLQLVESIDHRLELVNTKLDQAIAQMVTKSYCSTDCDVRKNAISKQYFLGWGACLLLVIAAMGAIFKFL